MTLTPREFALASMAAPEPESRLTSSSTLAPLVIICSACCCCVDLSPSAFWMSASTPAASKAFFRNGRSTVSQRTEDLESGSRTPTLPAFASVLVPPELPEFEFELLLSSPQAATKTAAVAASRGMSRAARFIRSSSSRWTHRDRNGDELSDRRRPGMGIRHDGRNFVKNLDELRRKRARLLPTPNEASGRQP